MTVYLGRCSMHGEWENSIAECPECTPVVAEDKLNKGMEAKAAKLDYSLIVPEPIESLVKVLMFGANKYEAFGWQKYPDPKFYTNAIERHMAEIKKGILIDSETGYSHYAHVMCSAMFLEWHRLNGEKK